jgi:zinc protease
MRHNIRVGSWILVILAIAFIASAQNAPFWPTEEMPRPLAPREVKFPPYEIRSLPNGMQVITVLHHEQPAVTMRLLVRAGSAQDPQKKKGVASLVASLLDQGTATRSAQQIADQIDSIGGAMGTGSGPDLTFVNAIVMKDSFDLAMNLLADVVRNPAFAPEEIERQKEQTLSTQQVNINDPDYVASVVFDRLVYGFHPYGLPGSGTPDTIASLTRDDLQAFHRAHFVPNNMVLAIVGDLTSQEAFAAAEKVFGAWPRGEIPAWNAIEPPDPTRRVVIIDMPESVQTEIRLGQLAIKRKDPDYLAWDLAMRILGGEGANRLHRVLRSERGLTYGAEADTEARKFAGDFLAETDTRTETTGQALRLMVEELSRLQRQRVSERELSDAQAYVAGSFPLTIETPNDIATQVINQVFYELPVEEIPTYRERVQAISPDDIQRVAKQYIKPDRLSIVLVGNAKGFVPQLQSVGFTEFEIIPVAQLDLMAATLRRESGQRVSNEPFGSSPFGLSRVAYLDGQQNPGGTGPRRPSPTFPAGAVQESLPNTKEAVDLLRRVVAAKGGLEALKGVRTVTADADTTLQMQQGALPSKTKTYVSYPDKFRVDAEVNGAKTSQVYVAGRAWVIPPTGGVMDAPPPALAEMAASVRRDTIPLLIGASEGRYNVRTPPDEKGRGGKLMKVLEISGIDLPAVRLYVDDQMLIAGQAFSTTIAPSRRVLSEEVFSDYRVVSGIRVPFEAQLLQNGQSIVKRVLTKVVLNETIPESVFQRPQ